MVAKGEARRINCALCGRNVAISWVLHDWEKGERGGLRDHLRRYATRVEGGWATPANHRQLLASGRLSAINCTPGVTAERERATARLAG